jgi:hypothetical protein
MLEDWMPTNEPNPSNATNFKQTLKTTLPNGSANAFAWRKGFELTSTNPGPALAEMGDKMATDPLVHACALARSWNMIMTRGDVVYSEAQVPGQVHAVFTDENGNEYGGVRVLDPNAADPADPFGEAKDLLAQFQTNNFGLKSVLREMLLSEDFLKF